MSGPSYDLDDVTGMVVFAAVAERGSFTAAATDLGLAKSVVSARVARLEDRLGVRLLHRTTRRVSLTPAGAEVYPLCARVAQAAAEAHDAAAGEAAEPRGRLRINAPVTFGQRWLGPVVASFLARHPAVHPEIVLQDEVVDVASGAWDVVIRIGEVRDPELTARRFGRDVPVVVASPAYLARHGVPRHPFDLARHQCLRYLNIPGDQEWRFRVDGAWRSVPVVTTVAASDGTLLGELAIAGAGVVIAPWFIVGEAVRAGRLTRLLADHPTGELPFHAVHLHGRRTPAKVRAFVDHLVGACATPPWGAPD